MSGQKRDREQEFQERSRNS